MALITKKLLEHLAHLARLELTDAETKKFGKDLESILKYFKELQTVDTEGIEPMLGAADLKNILRSDEVDIDYRAQSRDAAGKIIKSFPESEKGYLKVPKVL